MRQRLSALLLALMGVALVSLGVPLAGSIASSEARTLHADRLADLTLFDSLVPPPSDPGHPDALQAEQAEDVAVQQDLRRYDELYGIRVSVVNASGHAWLSSRSSPLPAAMTSLAQGSIRTALSGRLPEQNVRLLPWNHQPLVVAEPVVRDGDVVGAIFSVSPTGAARWRVLKWWLVLAGAEVIALLGAAVLTGRMSTWLLRPVAWLDETAHQISAGDLSARVPAGGGPPELRRLGDSFNEMAAHVQEAVEAQRAFVADASHQLRNPMAALLIRLEGLQMTIPGQVPAAAQSALLDGQNLAGTLDRMLALARVEHVRASPGAIDIAALVDERLDSWRVVAERRSIQVHRSGERSAIGMHEPGALMGAIDAVLDNSMKYSPAHSQVTVDVRAQGSSVVVRVTDDGPGIPAEELSRLGERFWRSDRTARESGTGLGMSIAKTLLERHSGRLQADLTDDRGLCVSLEIPRPERQGSHQDNQGLVR
jgi:signal transduction histidine kinase